MKEFISLKDAEKQMLKKFLKRITIAFSVILGIRLIRLYIRNHSNEFSELREHYLHGNEAAFVNAIIPLLVLFCFILIIVLFAIKGRAAIVHPLFMGIVIFLVADLAFLILYPELFVAVLDTTLFYNAKTID